MAKMILVCSRKQSINPYLVNQIEQICNRLIPDNITPVPPDITIVDNGVLQAIISPTQVLHRYRSTVCLGHMISPSPDWWQIGAEPPDGTYALFRSDAEQIEILTDVVGLRTIWYCLTDELFIASTSQRAIITLLGDFQFNESTIPWMLSTGSLGPEGGWDQRIYRLRGDARLLLDRKFWTVSVQEQPVVFEPGRLSRKEYTQRALDALTSSVASARHLSWNEWCLALSGGYDSRGVLLLLLQQRIKPRCITTGLRSSLSMSHNDAFIAEKVAEYYGVSHTYFELDEFDVTPEQIIERFLVASEGRIDHISNFMDGLETFNLLVNDGIAGMVRGDQSFGHYPAVSPLGVRQDINLRTLRDFFGKEQTQAFELPPQVWPAWMERRPGETLDTWRDRLYQQFRMPVVIAALTDITHVCFETFAPLTSRQIIGLVRQFPDQFREYKRVLADIVRWMSPPVDFAGSRSMVPPKDLLQRPGFVHLIYDELCSAHAQTVLSDGVRLYALKNLRLSENVALKVTKHREKRIKRLLPQHLKDFIKSTGMGPSLDPNVFAFRAYIISRMTRMLTADGQYYAEELESSPLRFNISNLHSL